MNDGCVTTIMRNSVALQKAGEPGCCHLYVRHSMRSGLVLRV